MNIKDVKSCKKCGADVDQLDLEYQPPGKYGDGDCIKVKCYECNYVCLVGCADAELAES